MASKPTASPDTQIANVSSNFSSQIAGQVLLSTAIVIIKTNSGPYSARALIDSGSQASFISKKNGSTSCAKEASHPGYGERYWRFIGWKIYIMCGLQFIIEIQQQKLLHQRRGSYYGKDYFQSSDEYN